MKKVLIFVALLLFVSCSDNREKFTGDWFDRETGKSLTLRSEGSKLLLDYSGSQFLAEITGDVFSADLQGEKAIGEIITESREANDEPALSFRGQTYTKNRQLVEEKIKRFAMAYLPELAKEILKTNFEGMNYSINADYPCSSLRQIQSYTWMNQCSFSFNPQSGNVVLSDYFGNSYTQGIDDIPTNGKTFLDGFLKPYEQKYASFSGDDRIVSRIYQVSKASYVLDVQLKSRATDLFGQVVQDETICHHRLFAKKYSNSVQIDFRPLKQRVGKYNPVFIEEYAKRSLSGNILGYGRCGTILSAKVLFSPKIGQEFTKRDTNRDESIVNFQINDFPGSFSESLQIRMQ
jgi:hypothetical protein